LNRAADDLPGALKSRRLAAESAVIAAIARRLTDRLARRDPVAERVELSKPALAAATLTGLLRALCGRRP